MLGKMTKHHVMNQLNKAKDFIGNAYNHTKNFLGHVDNGVRIVKHVYGAVAPILESYGVEPKNKHIMKALSGYDNIRSNVMENHDRVVNDVNKVKHKLSKVNINP